MTTLWIIVGWFSLNIAFVLWLHWRSGWPDPREEILDNVIYPNFERRAM